MSWFSVIKKPQVTGEKYGIKIDEYFPDSMEEGYYDNDIYLKDEIWEKISDYPSDMRIIERNLDKGLDIDDALEDVFDKYWDLNEKFDDEDWSKETIEEKLGRKLTPEDYEREKSFEDEIITNLAISRLIMNNDRAIKVWKNIMKLKNYLTRRMMEKRGHSE
tara:strand:- start:43 stop:528 length:486 start_codon:yes stop_codon:yes gene_type:complete